MGSWSIELLNRKGFTYLSGFTYSGKGEGSFFFFSEQIDNFIGMHCTLIPGDGLGKEHLNDADHASPSYICKLLQSSIRKPDNFLEVIVEHITLILIVDLAQETYLFFVLGKGQRSARREGKLEDAVILQIVGDVCAE